MGLPAGLGNLLPSNLQNNPDTTKQINNLLNKYADTVINGISASVRVDYNGLNHHVESFVGEANLPETAANTAAAWAEAGKAAMVKAATDPPTTTTITEPASATSTSTTRVTMKKLILKTLKLTDEKLKTKRLRKTCVEQAVEGSTADTVDAAKGMFDAKLQMLINLGKVVASSDGKFVMIPKKEEIYPSI